MKNKRHYHCYSFFGKDPESGNSANTSVYVGYKQKNVTLKMIERAKIDSGLTKDACVLSISYLGYMTREEFTGDSK